MKKNSFLLFLLLFIINVFATSEVQKVIINDLSDDWLVYDDERGYYLPVVDFSENATKTRSLYQDFQRANNYHLTFFAQKGLCLYVNNQLCKKYVKPKEINLSIDSILSIQENSRLLLTFFHPDYEVPHQVYLTYIPDENKDLLSYSDFYSVVGRVKQLETETLIVVFCLFLGLITYLKYSASFWFTNYFDVINLFFGRYLDDQLYTKGFNAPAFVAVVIISLVFNAILKLFNLDFLGVYSLGIIGQYQNIGVIAMGTMYVFLFLLLKYFYLILVSSFLRMGQFFKRHYFDSTRFYLFTVVFIFLLSLAGVPLQFLSYIITVLFALWALRLGLLVKKEAGFRKIYLFSYLCATELIPVILLLGQVSFI
ncbi:MAG: DUF4271 domain-containing protein [Cytophagales bacterium]|nr:DUF4271 domain-containing protein [Cytophagales bacterium]